MHYNSYDIKTLLSDRDIDIPEARTAWLEDLNKERLEFWETNMPVLTSEALPIKPQRVIHAVNQHLTEHSVVIHLQPILQPTAVCLATQPGPPICG